MSISSWFHDCVLLQGSSWPRNPTCVSYVHLHWQAGSLPLVPPRKPYIKCLTHTVSWKFLSLSLSHTHTHTHTHTMKYYPYITDEETFLRTVVHHSGCKLQSSELLTNNSISGYTSVHWNQKLWGTDLPPIFLKTLQVTPKHKVDHHCFHHSLTQGHSGWKWQRRSFQKPMICLYGYTGGSWNPGRKVRICWRDSWNY